MLYRVGVFGGTVAIVLGAASCGGGMTTPTPVTPPPPPVVVNTPPTITALTLGALRVEADQEVGATAVVQDAETPVDQLSYAWSATPNNGEFIGAGREVKWRAPKVQTTPDVYTLKVIATEKYTSNGEAKENNASQTAQIHYNDSPREVMKISMRFLTELFPNVNVTAKDAVQDFTDSCREKQFEFDDVANNRINFRILSGSYTAVSVDINSARTGADVSGRCVFEDIPLDPKNPNYGKRETVTGICRLTAVYENWRWWLCSSHFDGLGTATTGSLRYRVPGRPSSPGQ